MRTKIEMKDILERYFDFLDVLIDDSYEIEDLEYINELITELECQLKLEGVTENNSEFVEH